MRTTFTILGTPVAKGRPRLGKYGTYTPEKTVEYENLIRTIYQTEGHPKHEGYVGLVVRTYMPIPKSTSKKNRALMIEGEIRPAKRPDADNILKIYGDALNGIAWDDDSQVVAGHVMKWYSEQPRVEVIICSSGNGKEV
jgi:Holliday junction resolvase RusA-like endonuclease